MFMLNTQMPMGDWCNPIQFYHHRAWIVCMILTQFLVAFLRYIASKFIEGRLRGVATNPPSVSTHPSRYISHFSHLKVYGESLIIVKVYPTHWKHTWYPHIIVWIIDNDNINTVIQHSGAYIFILGWILEGLHPHHPRF